MVAVYRHGRHAQRAEEQDGRARLGADTGYRFQPCARFGDRHIGKEVERERAMLLRDRAQDCLDTRRFMLWPSAGLDGCLHLLGRCIAYRLPVLESSLEGAEGATRIGV